MIRNGDRSMQDFDFSFDPKDSAALRRLRAAIAEAPSPAEQEGFESILFAFRATLQSPAYTPRAQRRGLRFATSSVPASMAVAAAIVFPATAVAAAYSSKLPEPVQRWAHAALHNVGVPAPHHSRVTPPARKPDQGRSAAGSDNELQVVKDEDREGRALKLRHSRCRGPISEAALRRPLSAAEYRNLVAPGATHLYVCAREDLPLVRASSQPRPSATPTGTPVANSPQSAP